MPCIGAAAGTSVDDDSQAAAKAAYLQALSVFELAQVLQTVLLMGQYEVPVLYLASCKASLSSPVDTEQTQWMAGVFATHCIKSAEVMAY